jgi:arylsulfatase A-like enzyme
MFGKWHNTPEPDISPAGPFDRWPTGIGFDYFYGFNQGETDQYYPVIYRNTTWVPQPKSPEQGYHFTTDMTTKSSPGPGTSGPPTARSRGSSTSAPPAFTPRTTRRRSTVTSTRASSTTAWIGSGR